MPAQMQEFDERTPFSSQLGPGSGPVVLINKFTVGSEDDVDAFVSAWGRAAKVMQGQSGFVSTQLHRGLGDSLSFVNVANWESAEDLRNAITAPEFLATHGDYPDGTVSSPHAFTKLAVDGVG